MVRELVLWKSGVPIFQPSGGKGREQISAKVMSSSWTKNESSYNIHTRYIRIKEKSNDECYFLIEQYLIATNGTYQAFSVAYNIIYVALL